MKSLKKSLLILIICLLLFLGFYRDFVFKNINALLKAWDFDLEYSMPNSLKLFENLEYATLVNLKWLLTLLFSIIYLIIPVYTIHLLFKNKKYTVITIYLYVSITVMSSLFILTGVVFENTSDKMYEFARYFMGMLQSPIILMILIPTFKLAGKNVTE